VGGEYIPRGKEHFQVWWIKGREHRNFGGEEKLRPRGKSILGGLYSGGEKKTLIKGCNREFFCSVFFFFFCFLL